LFLAPDIPREKGSTGGDPDQHNHTSGIPLELCGRRFHRIQSVNGWAQQVFTASLVIVLSSDEPVRGVLPLYPHPLP
jgi:hypothetical protein